MGGTRRAAAGGAADVRAAPICGACLCTPGCEGALKGGLLHLVALCSSIQPRMAQHSASFCCFQVGLFHDGTTFDEYFWGE